MYNSVCEAGVWTNTKHPPQLLHRNANCNWDAYPYSDAVEILVPTDGATIYVLRVQRANLWRNPYGSPVGKLYPKRNPLSESHTVWNGIVHDLTIHKTQLIQPLATLAVTKRISSRQFLFDDHMRLAGWRNNNTAEYRWSAGIIEDAEAFSFSGIHVISPEIFQHMPLSGKFSITDTYLELAASHTILGYDHSGDHVLDVGKPESLEKAALLFK